MVDQNQFFSSLLVSRGNSVDFLPSFTGSCNPCLNYFCLIARQGSEGGRRVRAQAGNKWACAEVMINEANTNASGFFTHSSKTLPNLG
jgi:hypothetical protein